MDASTFFNLAWKDADKAMEKMTPSEMKAALAFAHGYIEQHKKGRC